MKLPFVSNKGIAFVLWDSIQLSKKLKEFPELVDDFFGREWVRAFCGSEAAERLGEKFDQSVFADYLRAIEQFSSDTPLRTSVEARGTD